MLRLLASLEHARPLQRLDTGSYALGSEVARLSDVYAASFSVDRIVMPVLRELVAKAAESAAYHVRQGAARLCLYRVDSPHPIAITSRPACRRRCSAPTAPSPPH